MSKSIHNTNREIKSGILFYVLGTDGQSECVEAWRGRVESDQTKDRILIIEVQTSFSKHCEEAERFWKQDGLG